MLSGNVEATINAGVLELLGDRQDNEIAVVVDSDAATISLQGRDGTTINGQGSLVFDDADDLKIDLRNGDNRAIIKSASNVRADLAGLEFDSFSGSDVVVLEKIRVTGAAEIHTRQGDDLVEIRDSGIRNSILNLSVGNDGLRIDRSYVANSTIALGTGNDALDIRGTRLIRQQNSDFWVLGGAGDDTINVVDTDLIGVPVTIRGGAGFDYGLIESAPTVSVEQPGNNPYYALERIFGHPGFADSSELRDATTHDVRLTVNAAGDVVLRGTRFDDRIHVSTDNSGTIYTFTGISGTTINGQSEIGLTNVKSIDLSLRAGDDEFSLFRAIYDNRDLESVTADLGTGDDYFEVLRQDFTGRIQVDGGGGNDYINVHLAENYGVTLEGGEGDDVIDYFNNVTRGGTLILTGPGNDRVLSMYNQFGTNPFIIDGGNGDDYVSYHFNTHYLSQVVSIRGGAGADTFNSPASTSDSQFENFLSNWVAGTDEMEFHQLYHLSISPFLFLP